MASSFTLALELMFFIHYVYEYESDEYVSNKICHDFRPFLFASNWSITFLCSSSNVLTNSLILFATAEIAFSSNKFCNAALFKQKNKLFMNILNKN